MDVREARLVRSVLVPSAAFGLAAALAVGVAGCAPDGAAAVPPSHDGRVHVRDLTDHTLVLPSEDPAELAVTASQLVFDRSPVLVLASSSDAEAAHALTAVATALHAPALLADGSDDRAVRSEAERLGARAAVVVQEDRAAVEADADGTWSSPAPSDAESSARAAGLAVVTVDTDDVLGSDGGVPASDPPAQAVPGAPAAPESGADHDPLAPEDADAAAALDPQALADLRDQLGSAAPEEPASLLTEALVLVDPAPGQQAALATLRAAGAVTVTAKGGDPGTSGDVVRTLADADALTVIGVGPGIDAKAFAWQVAAAETGQLLPTGSQRIAGAAFTSARLRVGEPVTAVEADPGTLPALVLRAAVRQWSAGTDGTYVRHEPTDDLAVSVDAAHAAGQYVVLELEGGRVSLADQVSAVEPLLAKGGVGVMVHPEQRRSGAGAERGGRVSSAELQAVVDRLSSLAVKKSLPQMLLAVQGLDAAVDGEPPVAVPQVAVVDASDLGLVR